MLLAVPGKVCMLKIQKICNAALNYSNPSMSLRSLNICERKTLVSTSSRAVPSLRWLIAALFNTHIVEIFSYAHHKSFQKKTILFIVRWNHGNGMSKKKKNKRRCEWRTLRNFLSLSCCKKTKDEFLQKIHHTHLFLNIVTSIR